MIQLSLKDSCQVGLTCRVAICRAVCCGAAYMYTIEHLVQHPTSQYSQLFVRWESALEQHGSQRADVMLAKQTK